MTMTASDRSKVLDHRIALSERIYPQRATYLAHLLGLRLDAARLDEPFSPKTLARARPSPADPTHKATSSLRPRATIATFRPRPPLWLGRS
ncbi:hypothetical protein HNQ99_002875 [Rhizorhapis suberifaciens]|uniref:Uncharacterized protein n=1 Tax=Rhizorhapis suberifaciens TaxID=13656 RepID=A0A840HYS2_9SPHN|nr:hypothetical protein [Rhizorhapis suberifaciens]